MKCGADKVVSKTLKEAIQAIKEAGFKASKSKPAKKRSQC
jgi:hypothetical protein